MEARTAASAQELDTDVTARDNRPAESGLKAVFLAQRPMLLRLVAARLGSANEAEDVLQDMWFKLERPVAQPVAEPSGYLYRMAVNLAADRRIASARRQARDATWIDTQPDDRDIPDAARDLVGRERLAHIEAAIAEMPERMREALRLFRIERWSQRAIADQLGISVSGVEKLLQRAYVKILDSDRKYDEDS